MSTLEQFKTRLQRDLKESWKHTPNDEQEYFSLSYDWESVPLLEILPQLSSPLTGFFHSPLRKQKQTVLAFWPLEMLTHSLAFNRMEKLLKQNPQLTFFGGQRFHSQSIKNSSTSEWNSFHSYDYFLPALCLENKNDQTTLTVTWPRSIISDKKRQDIFLSRMEKALTPSNGKTSSRKFNWIQNICNQKRWNEVVDSALKDIRLNRFEKVVVARKQIYSLKSSYPLSSLFVQSTSLAKDSYQYYYQKSADVALMSVSPECLFELNGDHLEVDALAGTRPRGADSISDKELERELLDSSKERREHNLVIKDLESKMSTVCFPQKRGLTKVLKLAHVQHLWTPLAGKLRHAQTLETLLKLFHPTPAVAGYPADKAQNFIEEEEEIDRGFFAGPIGIIQKNYAHFAVAIRSALISRNRLHVYAGAGIVRGSQGEEEWKETRHKMQNFLKIL